MKLHLSTSGHYCIDIDPSTGKIDALPDITEKVFALESSLSHSDKVKQVDKSCLGQKSNLVTPQQKI